MTEPTMGERARWTFYQRFIAGHVNDTDPRHIEAWMRTEYPTLDGLSRSEFVRAMYEALGQVQDAGPEGSEALAGGSDGPGAITWPGLPSDDEDAAHPQRRALWR